MLAREASIASRRHGNSVATAAEGGEKNVSPRKKQLSKTGNSRINPFYLPPQHPSVSTSANSPIVLHDSNSISNYVTMARADTPPPSSESSTISSKMCEFFRSLCCCYGRSKTGSSSSSSSQQHEINNRQTVDVGALYQYEKDWVSSDLQTSRKSNFQMTEVKQKRSTTSQRNSITSMLDVLHYSPDSYCSLRLGHYSFLQIPVRFEHHSIKRKVSYIDEFARIFCGPSLPQEAAGSGGSMLLIQTCLDEDFAESLAKTSSHVAVVCMFASAHPMLTRAQLSSQQGQSSQGKNNAMKASSQSASQMKHLEAVQQISEQSKVEFINSVDVDFTLRTADFDRIVVIPASLKQPANAFDSRLRMSSEFKRSLITSIHQFATVLDKVVFVLPKYAKVAEIVFAIFEAFSMNIDRGAFTIEQLNIGIQIHSLLDDQQDVDAIVLVFDREQHLDTLTALSLRVFSNINPRGSTSKSHNGEGDGGGGEEDEEFLEEEYVRQIGKCTMKNLYLFLKHLNSCFILPSNVNAYRTFVLDAMLAYRIVENDFIETLISYFTLVDAFRFTHQPVAAVAGKPQTQQQKLQASSFGEHFMNHSREYTKKPLQIEKLTHSKEEHRDAGYLDLHNTTETQIRQPLTTVSAMDLEQEEERNERRFRNIIASNNLDSKHAPPRSPMSDARAERQRGGEGVVDNRPKHQSCNFYTTTAFGKNKHIGFKGQQQRLADSQGSMTSVDDCSSSTSSSSKKKQKRQSIRDNQIINYTTATIIVEEKRIVVSSQEKAIAMKVQQGRKYSQF